MYRLRLSTDSQPNIGHQNKDLDQDTFQRIVQGQWIEADAEAQDRLSIEIVYYTGVWNPDSNQWVADLAQDQISSAYESWFREIYP